MHHAVEHRQTKLFPLLGVQSMNQNDGAFAVLRVDGSVVAWGDADCGGDRTKMERRLHERQKRRSFMPISNVGGQSCSAEIWNDSAYDAECSPDDDDLGSDYDSMNKRAHLTHPHSPYGRVKGQLASGVKSVYHSDRAFAALKADGSVVAWGEAKNQAKAVSEPLTELQESGVVASIVRNDNAIAALNADGSVVAWGDKGHGGDCSMVKVQLATDVQSIYSTNSAFAALKVDGSVVAWGSSTDGGDGSTVKEQLAADVQSIHSTNDAFAALKADGSVVAWGEAKDQANAAKAYLVL